MIIVIDIPDSIRNIAQKGDIEKTARQDIIISLLKNTDINISNERFLQYQKDYEEKYFIFELIKTEIEHDFVLPAIKNKKLKNWNLDYYTCKITIQVENDDEKKS